MIILNYKGLCCPADFVGKVVPCNAATQEIEQYQIIQWYKKPNKLTPNTVEHKDGKVTKRR